MAKMHRRWSEAQKLQIIQEVEQSGLTETLRKYTVAQFLKDTAVWPINTKARDVQFLLADPSTISGWQRTVMSCLSNHD